MSQRAAVVAWLEAEYLRAKKLADDTYDRYDALANNHNASTARIDRAYERHEAASVAPDVIRRLLRRARRPRV